MGRSADAEPEAEADAFYGTYGYGLSPYTYGAYNGYAGYGYSGLAGYPYTYGAYPYASYAAAPAVTVAAPAVTKVEAAPAVSTVAAAPAVAAYAPYTYGAYALPTAPAQVSPSASLTTLGLADPSIPAVGGAYAGAGRYVANSAGVVHVAKRSADAEPEAEADAFYGTYGYGLSPYTYGAYNGYAGYGYSGLAGYPYTYGAYPYASY